MLASAVLQADGIAISSDGLIWTKGVGAFGEGWGATGTGINVREGETLYVKFYSSDKTNIALRYAEHGRDWDSWRTTGPAIQLGAGDGSGNPIILRISHIGTPRSTVMWTNGKGSSGRWTAFTSVGAYDLGLHPGKLWTVPPINVTKATESRSFWGDFFGWFKPDNPAATTIHSVPDGGATAALLALALLALAGVHRTLK